VRGFKKMLVDGGLSSRLEELAVSSEELAAGQQTFLRAMEETKRQLQAVLHTRDLAFFSSRINQYRYIIPGAAVTVAVLAGLNFQFCIVHGSILLSKI
jgi:phosphoserine phosphatase